MSAILRRKNAGMEQRWYRGIYFVLCEVFLAKGFFNGSTRECELKTKHERQDELYVLMPREANASG